MKLTARNADELGVRDLQQRRQGQGERPDEDGERRGGLDGLRAAADEAPPWSRRRLVAAGALGLVRVVLALSGGALPRLMADNLIRAQSRVILTILTLSLALLTITAVTGITSFTLNVALKYAMRRLWRAMPVNLAGVWA